MRNRRHSSHLLALSTADAAPRPRRTFLYPLPYFPLSQIPRMPSACRLRSCSHPWLPARALDETIKLQLCCQELVSSSQQSCRFRIDLLFIANFAKSCGAKW